MPRDTPLAFTFFVKVGFSSRRVCLKQNQLDVMSTATESIEKQFDAAVYGLAIVDHSSVGRIEVTGADRLDLLHRLSTNNLLAGKPGGVIGTVFTTDKGRIVDYVYVLVRAESLLLLTSPSNESNLVKWIDKYTIMEDLHLNVVTDTTAQFTLVGPRAKEAAELASGVLLVHNQFAMVGLPFGKATITYRNEFQTDFVDFIVDEYASDDLRKLLLSNAGMSGLGIMGSNAFEPFRISRGIPSIGAELSDAFNPFEAGLLHAISFNKGCYIGQEVIARLDTYQKIQKSLFGVVFPASTSGLKRGSTALCNKEEVGMLTSVSSQPVRRQLVGIGILKKHHVRTDDHVSIVCDGITVQGILRPIPVVL